MMVCAVTLISICSEGTKKPNKCACVLINRVRKYFYNKHFGNVFCRVPPGKDPVSNR